MCVYDGVYAPFFDYILCIKTQLKLLGDLSRLVKEVAW